MLKDQKLRPPTKQELLQEIDAADRRLTSLFSRWSDHVSPEIRAEVRSIAEPLFELLRRAGLRK